MSSTAAHRAFTWVATAAVVLVVLAAAWGGSWEVQHRGLDLAFLERFHLPRIEWPPRTVPEPGEPIEPGEDGDPGWFGAVLAIAVGAVALAVVVFVAVRLLQRLWSWLRDRAVVRHPAVPASGDGLSAADGEPELPVLRRGVAEAQRHLARIDRPVDAVVAAWLALEEAAASSGVARSPAQTPTEFTVDVLARTSADADATADLLGLYHRARFSRQPIGPAEVADAARCLGRLAASWDAVAADRGSGS